MTITFTIFFILTISEIFYAEQINSWSYTPMYIKERDTKNSNFNTKFQIYPQLKVLMLESNKMCFFNII